MKDDIGTPSDEKKPLNAAPTHINETRKKQKDKVQRVSLVNSDSKNELQAAYAAKSRLLQAKQKVNHPQVKKVSCLLDKQEPIGESKTVAT